MQESKVGFEGKALTEEDRARFNAPRDSGGRFARGRMKAPLDFKFSDDLIGDKSYGSGNSSVNKLTNEGHSGKIKTNNYSKFRNEDKLEEHIVKHLSDYPTYSSDDYVRRASELLNSEDNENIKSFISKNGKLYKYDIKENDYCVGDSENSILTLYKPKHGIKYWERKVKSNE